MGILMIYQEILIVMALFIFIVNQANILYDTFHIAFIRHRVIKKMRELLPTYPLVAADKSDTSRSFIEWEWPSWRYIFNWWSISVALLIALAGMLLYIYFGYDPNPSA